MTATRTPAKAATASGRQVIRFTSIDEVMKVAEVIYRSGSLPKDVNKPEKVAMMLIAGAEVGFGVAQTMKSVLPPVNGQCALYGDAGLALIRSSGLLDRLDEKVEGQGDERTASVTIQRKGYEAKTFTYSTALAQKLKSYKKSHEQKSGPWHDDPDNMLTWRARWRAFRTEFADVLYGMGGAEELEDEVITVEAHARPAALPSSPPPAALPAAAVGLPCAGDDQLAEISRLRNVLRESVPDADKQKQEWAEFLAPFKVETAKQLTPEQADQFIEAVGAKYDPFTYPSESKT